MEQLVAELMNPPDLISRRTTRLETNVTISSLGFSLLRENPTTGDWHSFQSGSRQLSDRESRLAICELELLAIFWGLTKCRHWELDCDHIKVITNEASVIRVFSGHKSDITNFRLLRLRNRCMQFNFNITWRNLTKS